MTHPMACAASAAILLVSIATQVVWAPRAGAQTPSRDLFRDGVDALRDGRFSDAADAFAASHAIRPAPATLCNLALTFDRWGGHEEQALESYERCAEEDESGRFRAHALERAEALRGSLEVDEEDPAEARVAPTQRLPDPFVRRGAPGGEPVQTRRPSAQLVASPSGYPGAAPSGVERSHTWLWLGLVGTVVAGGALAGGLLWAHSARSDERYLDSMYPDRQIPGRLPDGSPNPDAAVLDDARTSSDRATAAYIVAGALGALSLTLVAVDLTAPDPVGASAGLAPLEGGALVSARIPFR